MESIQRPKDFQQFSYSPPLYHLSYRRDQAGEQNLSLLCFCSPTAVKKSFCRSKMHLPFEDGSKEEPVFPYRKSNQG